jgi:small conductance mechanosensitive channel
MTSPFGFWARSRDNLKNTMQMVLWILFALSLLYLTSFGLSESARRISQFKEGEPLTRFSDELLLLSQWIKQGADLIIRIIVVAVVGVWGARFFQGVVRRMLNGRAVRSGFESHPRGIVRTQTLLTTSGYLINIAVFALCLMIVLQLLGVSVAPLLATAGLASVAIGFGAQSLVRDFLTGFFILLEDQFAVGDVVTIDSRSGVVESLTLRCTKLRLSDGSLLVIPNGEIKRIENATSGFSLVDYRIAVLYGPKVEQALVILSEQIKQLSRDFCDDVLDTPEVLGIDSIKDSKVVLRAKLKTKPGKQYALERELHGRVLRRFLDQQVSLPTT